MKKASSRRQISLGTDLEIVFNLPLRTILVDALDEIMKHQWVLIGHIHLNVNMYNYLFDGIHDETLIFV